MHRPPVTQNKFEGFYTVGGNEGAFGPYREYPYSYPLYKKIAEYHGIHIPNILLTRGAEEGIRFALEAYAQNKKLLRPEPTFGMLPVFESLYNITPVLVPYVDLKLDLSSFISRIPEVDAVYLASPDSPTGFSFNFFDLVKIIDCCNKHKVQLILDCTYIDFTNKYFWEALIDYQDVVLLFSFSKSRGLAGLRAGYIISSQKNIEKLSLYRYMHELPSPVIKKCIKSFNDKILEKNIYQVKKWKDIFASSFPNSFISTDTNFILLDTYNQNVANNLLKEKIVIKNSMGHLRFSVGNNRAMKKILKHCRKYYD